MGGDGRAVMGEPQGVSPASLSLEQLHQVNKQLEQEVKQFRMQMSTMSGIIDKIDEAKEALDAITPANQGKSMMVPLTKSLYCPGRLTSSNKVLIEIGTGYYVRKDKDKAVEFFDRKLELVPSQLEFIKRLEQEKQKNQEEINIVMSQRMRAEAGSKAA